MNLKESRVPVLTHRCQAQEILQPPLWDWSKPTGCGNFWSLTAPLQFRANCGDSDIKFKCQGYAPYLRSFRRCVFLTLHFFRIAQLVQWLAVRWTTGVYFSVVTVTFLSPECSDRIQVAPTLFYSCSVHGCKLVGFCSWCVEDWMF